MLENVQASTCNLILQAAEIHLHITIFHAEMSDHLLGTTPMNLPYKNAAELVAALANRDISAADLLDTTIARIEKYDEKINAVITKDFARARIAAKEADAAIARGERKPLLGLPMTVKESFNISGLSTSWGNTAFKDWRPDADALTISRLKSAGAIIIGKTNVPCMLGDWQTYNDIHGITNNPWNVKLTPGGSSGGSAAALAAGYVALELGSDLAGSLRVPAHFCGIYAHKPSADLVPLRGASPPTMPASANKVDFAVAGPMARTADDLLLGLQVLAGPDEWADGVGYRLTLPDVKQKHLSEFRVLVLDQHPLYPTAPDIVTAIDKLANHLEKAGTTVLRKHPAPPDLSAITYNYCALLAAWFTLNMPTEVFQQMETAAKTLSDDDTSLGATWLRGTAMNHRDWLLTTRTREQLKNQWQKLYDDVDVVLCPVLPTLAFPHDHTPDYEKRTLEIAGNQVAYSHQYIWVCIANLFGLPATSAPIGLSESGLPIGIQLIGNYLQDKTTIAFASLLEREYGGFKIPPGFSTE